LPKRRVLLSLLFLICTVLLAVGDSTPPPDAFSVLPIVPPGPQITPYLQYQTEMAWREDEKRMRLWDGIRTEQDLLRVQNEIRQKLLSMLGGLPTIRTPLNSKITGRISMDGFHIEK